MKSKKTTKLPAVDDGPQVQMLSSKRSSGSTMFDQPEDDSDEDDDDDEAKKQKNRRARSQTIIIDFDDEPDDYKPQEMKFPPSKHSGSLLSLERLDFMAKDIERNRMGHKDAIAARKKKIEEESEWDAAYQEHENEDEDEDEGRTVMEEVFVECSIRSAHDQRLLELLGEDKVSELFQDQKRIVEYFRTKTAISEKKKHFSKMRDMVLADDDALSELTVWHGQVNAQPVTPKKAKKMEDALEKKPDAVEFGYSSEASNRTTTPSAPEKTSQAEKMRRLSMAPPKPEQLDTLQVQNTRALSRKKSFVSNEGPQGADESGLTKRAPRGFGRLLRAKGGAEADPSAPKNDDEGADSPSGSQPPSPSAKKGAAKKAGRKGVKKGPGDGTLPTLNVKKSED